MQRNLNLCRGRQWNDVMLSQCCADREDLFRFQKYLEWQRLWYKLGNVVLSIPPTLPLINVWDLGKLSKQCLRDNKFFGLYVDQKLLSETVLYPQRTSTDT